MIDSGGKLSTRLYDDMILTSTLSIFHSFPADHRALLTVYTYRSSLYDNFRYRHKSLVDQLLSQGNKALRLEKSLKKFYDRYQDFVEKFQESVKEIVNDLFPG